MTTQLNGKLGTHRGVTAFSFKDINEALYVLKEEVLENGDRVETRNGTAYEIPSPVAVTFNRPTRRVLFYKQRDANPVFHFLESIWMLAGRNDLEWIQNYNKRMAEYSDDGEILNGAYGNRWRNHFDQDQIEIACQRLIEYENDRRAVVTMWDPTFDLTDSNKGKDHPCNTHIYFSVRKNRLDMTVCNRSNDLIWGMCGANAVHMSMLQEYMASVIDVGIGIYTQFTNNLHAYFSTLEKLVDMQPDYDAYKIRGLVPYPLVDEPSTFLKEAEKFCSEIIAMEKMTEKKLNYVYNNAVFEEVGLPMHNMYMAWKDKNYDEAYLCAMDIKAADWRLACKEWLERRKPNGEHI